MGGWISSVFSSGYMVVRDDESVDDLIARAMAYAERIVGERKNLQA